jgi:hypothetical protein
VQGAREGGDLVELLGGWGGFGGGGRGGGVVERVWGGGQDDFYEGKGLNNRQDMRGGKPTPNRACPAPLQTLSFPPTSGDVAEQPLGRVLALGVGCERGVWGRSVMGHAWGRAWGWVCGRGGLGGGVSGLFVCCVLGRGGPRGGVGAPSWVWGLTAAICRAPPAPGPQTLSPVPQHPTVSTPHAPMSGPTRVRDRPETLNPAPHTLNPSPHTLKPPKPQKRGPTHLLQ